MVAGLCVLVWGLHARLQQYHVPTASLAASFMLPDHDERGSVVVTAGERFRSPLESGVSFGAEVLLEQGAAEAAVPARRRTSEAARLPIPPTRFKLLMRPPPAGLS